MPMNPFDDRNPPTGPDHLRLPLPPVGDATAAGDVPGEALFATVRTTRMPMVVTDPRQPDNPVVFCNHAFRQMTGYSDGEILGRNCRFLQGPDTDPDHVAEVRRALERREEVTVKMVNYRRDGSSFQNALFISPMFDDAGDLLYFFASQLDMSRHHGAAAAPPEAPSTALVGQSTDGIAQDFTTVLQLIIGYADMLGSRVDPADRPASRAVAAIGAAAQRGTTLMHRLRAADHAAQERDRQDPPKR